MNSILGLIILVGITLTPVLARPGDPSANSGGLIPTRTPAPQSFWLKVLDYLGGWVFGKILDQSLEYSRESVRYSVIDGLRDIPVYRNDLNLSEYDRNALSDFYGKLKRIVDILDNTRLSDDAVKRQIAVVLNYDFDRLESQLRTIDSRVDLLENHAREQESLNTKIQRDIQGVRDTVTIISTDLYGDDHAYLKWRYLFFFGYKHSFSRDLSNSNGPGLILGLQYDFVRHFGFYAEFNYVTLVRTNREQYGSIPSATPVSTTRWEIIGGMAGFSMSLLNPGSPLNLTVRAGAGFGAATFYTEPSNQYTSGGSSLSGMLVYEGRCELSIALGHKNSDFRLFIGGSLTNMGKSLDERPYNLPADHGRVFPGLMIGGKVPISNW